MAEIKVTKLAATMMEILVSYTQELEDGIENVYERIAAQSKEKLIANSPRNEKFAGKHYADDWHVKKNKSFHLVSWTVYNEQYQLTHLLENGHELRRQGGWSPAIPHITPVADEAVAELEEKIERVIKRGY